MIVSAETRRVLQLPHRRNQGISWGEGDGEGTFVGNDVSPVFTFMLQGCGDGKPIEPFPISIGIQK